MKKHTNTYSQGINQDISVNKYPNTSLYWAQNFRLISKDGLATGALTNVNGTLPKMNFGDDSKLIGYCTIRDTLVMFVKNSISSRILVWEHNKSDYEESPVLIYSSFTLNFDINKPVKAVGRYENERVQKIYFTDGSTFFKHLNIINPDWNGIPWGQSGSNKYIYLPYDIDSLDLVSDVTFSTMSLEILSGGDLSAGKIQYAYQLYSVRGSESVFSPASQLIHITNADETLSSEYYYGTEVGTRVNKTVVVTINNIDQLFTRLRLVAIEYTVLYQQPKIRIVGEYNVENLTSITISDTGNSIGELTVEEFLFVQNNFYPKSIDVKNDYLFAANITNDYFEITDDEFDARAFRSNAFNSIIVYNGNASVAVPYPFTTLPSQSNEQFNIFNDIQFDWNLNNKSVDSITRDLQYKFKPGSTGTVLGGAGVNISYEFVINQVILDDTQKSFTYGTSAGTYPKLATGASALFNNNANPSSLVGYQRDEIYRFGIIFFDKKGRQSFVKWIGDIRFPANTDTDSNNNYAYISYDNNNNRTMANILGIKFTVNIPSEVKNKISGYQIVRAERTNSDKTIIAQGLVGYPTKCLDVNSSFLYTQPTQCTLDNMVAETSRVQRDVPAYKSITHLDQMQCDDLTIQYDSRWIEFDSPDVVINKPVLPVNGAFIEVFGFQNEVETSAIAGVRGFQGLTEYVNENDNKDKRDILAADKTRGFDINSSVIKARSFITSSRIFQPKTRGNADSNPDFDATKVVIDEGQKYNNQTYLFSKGNTNAADKAALRGTYALLYRDEKLPLDTSWLSYGVDDIRFPVANYRVERGRSMYGGSTAEARSTTKYYPASTLVDKDTTIVDTYNGDTYISYFTYMRSLYDLERPNGSRIETYVFYPVESTINLNLRLDKMQQYINWGLFRDSNVTDYRLMENASMGVSVYGSNYPTDVGNLYRYNSAYSSIDKSKEYYPMPFDFTNNLVNDTRIVASEKKINGEYIDSWTQFRFNNYIDVDSKHNEITKIITFKNELYYFQPTAVGIASVNPRSLINDNNPGALVLGTGDVLDRYDYITDKSGSSFYESIVASDEFLFYADGRRKRLNKIIAGKEEAVSVIKGIDSLLDKQLFTNVRAGFDRGYNEVVFAIDDTLTLGFSEMANAFTSSYTYNPGIMFSLGNEFFSTGSYTDDTPLMYDDMAGHNVGYIGNSDADPTWDYIVISSGSTGTMLFKHNVGNPGEFYTGGGVIDDSYITLIINPQGKEVCYFDNLELISSSENAEGIDQVSDGFYRMEAENNYQSITRELSFVNSVNENTGSIKRIGRIWRTPILPVQTTGSNFKRMVDTYLKVTLRYQNKGNKFVVHDITTLYRTANH